MDIEDSLEQHILSIGKGKVVRKRKKPIIPILFLLVGIALSSQFHQVCDLYGSMLGNTILFFGLSFALYGICASFNKKYEYFSTDGQKLKKYSFGFDIQHYSMIKTLYDTENFAAISNVSQSDSPGVILDIMGSKNGNFYLSQMTKYIPHRYVAEDFGRLHEGVSILSIQEFLSLNKKAV